MTEDQLNQLGKTLCAIADDLRDAMNADDFRDYMRSFLFLRYVSTDQPEPQVDLVAVHTELTNIEKRIQKAAETHNGFLEELELPLV